MFNLKKIDLQHPQLAMSKGSGHSGNSSSLGTPSSSSSSSVNSNSNHGNSSNHHHGNIITNTFNEFLKSTFSFSSTSPGSKSSNTNINNSTSPQPAASTLNSSSSSNKNSPSIKTASINNSTVTSNSASVSPTSNSSTLTTSSNSYFAGAASASSPSQAHSASTPHNNNDHIDQLNTDLNNQLSLDNSLKSQQQTSNNVSGIPNSARVISPYTAITEDEITVQKGDIVQIITANMHNRFLVHREANELQPAAEGWIPGFVIGYQSTNLTH